MIRHTTVTLADVRAAGGRLDAEFYLRPRCRRCGLQPGSGTGFLVGGGDLVRCLDRKDCDRRKRALG